ncbi:MAG: hypothetical protein CBC55_05090 [Gammaproteobacteria bacterium TMED95]|nr:MAG: hypothetical protein CBC55_05090 [Gammaproteobacteria bacterium TMED95]|tara:strand:+ start:9595 stop:10314 length:720 start_codon:yes stop_codon:yes gene_type:complete
MNNFIGLTFLIILSYIPLVHSEVVSGHDEGLIFSYDPDPGELGGIKGEKDTLLGQITAFDYRNSTFSFWLNINSVQPDWTSIFHIGNVSMERYPAVWLYDNDTLLHYRIAADGYNNQSVETETPLALQIWVMVTTVWDEGVGTLYFNDVAMETYSNYTFSFLDSIVGEETWNVYASDPWHNPFDGYFDNLKIYDRAWSDEEILFNYNASIAVSVATPHFYFGAFLLGLLLPVRLFRYSR